MSGPLEDTYFDWLCAKVAKAKIPTPSLTYYALLRELHSTEFVWQLSGDDNRAEDGVDLRGEFIREATYLDPDQNWMNFPCSIFEMLYAFARRAAFDTSQSGCYWFWTFIENLDLARFNDAYITQRHYNQIIDILQRFVWRTYDPSGHGGICPLQRPDKDQRQVELWYQFCYYLVEQEY